MKRNELDWNIPGIEIAQFISHDTFGVFFIPFSIESRARLLINQMKLIDKTEIPIPFNRFLFIPTRLHSHNFALNADLLSYF